MSTDAIVQRLLERKKKVSRNPAQPGALDKAVDAVLN